MISKSNSQLQSVLFFKVTRLRVKCDFKNKFSPVKCIFKVTRPPVNYDFQVLFSCVKCIYKVKRHPPLKCDFQVKLSPVKCTSKIKRSPIKRHLEVQLSSAEAVQYTVGLPNASGTWFTQENKTARLDNRTKLPPNTPVFSSDRRVLACKHSSSRALQRSSPVKQSPPGND